MKTYNIKNRVSKEARAELERIINTHDRYKNAYFFRPATHASQRRKNEERFENNNPDVTFQTKEGDLIVKLRLEESCRNVYYSSSISLDEKAKDIRAVKKLLK